MEKNFWSGKKVFITGHTGFKGSWLSLWLQNSGAQVTGYALEPPTTPNMFEVAGVAGGMKSIIGDIRDFASLSRVLGELKPEIVIHMAAQSVVRTSYEDPIQTYSTNVMGTVNLLEAVRGIVGVKAVVNVTTDKCYDNREWLWGYRENDPLGGFDPYSNSKACSELVTSAYRSSFFSNPIAEGGPAIATARAGNVLGGGDWTKDQLIPDVIRAIFEDKSIEMRNPHSIRPWQFVLDPLRGYLMLAEKLYNQGKKFAEAWNFGPLTQEVYEVEWIARRILKLWNEKDRIVYGNENGPHEAGYLKLDSSKSYHLLRWKPLLSIPVTVDWTVDWYRAYKGDKDMKSITLDQIKSYEKLIAEK
jgi:CDP-glucose 4,6-dehydratase